jgi:Xaa-Pro aminopeptidase
MSYEIPKRVFEERFKKIRDYLARRDLKALMVFDSLNLTYTSGFLDDTRNPAERPIVCVVPHEAEPFMILCELSTHHALYEVEKGTCAVKDIRFYVEHPRQVNRTYLSIQWAEMVTDVLSEKKCLDGKICVDIRPAAVSPGLVSRLGSTSLVDASDLLQEMRLIKCREELDLIRECGPISDLGQKTLMSEIEAEKPQLEIGADAIKAMQREAAAKYPDAAIEIRANVMGTGPIFSPMPHTTRGMGRKVQKGDSLIDITAVRLNAYGVENERTFLVGKPTEKQARIFNVMVEAQRSALEAQRPGNKLSNVDGAAQRVIEDAGYGDYIMHRTYHGIGLGGHEYPYYTAFMNRKIMPGMVLSCEPGIYIPGFGGFRHSDTVIITEEGPELVTKFPRNLDSLTVKVQS